jgi:regulator of protease activity HflC (stomatin/prohibitin superfamily)
VKLKRLIVTTAAIATVVAGAGCSESLTDFQQQAIRYSGGTTQAEIFKNCQKDAKREWGDPGDVIYYYPSGQRTFTFTDDEKAARETGPLLVSTKDKQEMTVKGFITFQLTNDCKKLQGFHELIGKRLQADFEEGKFEDPGWSAFLAQYMTVPVNSIADSIGLQYNWGELYSDASIQVKFEQGMKDKLAGAINDKIGEGVITINAVDIQRPEPSQKLRDALQQAEQAKADGNARSAKVEADKKVQEQETQLAVEKAKTAAQCQKAYTREQCLILELAADGKIPFYPIPSGGSVIVQPR